MFDYVLMHGGGLDSSVVFMWAVKHQLNFCAVHVDYGQYAAAAESEVVALQCQKYGIPYIAEKDRYLKLVNPQPSIMFGTSKENPTLNMRNTQMVFIGAKYGTNILLGLDLPWNNAKSWPDASLEFMFLMNKLLKASFITREVTVSAPYIRMSKITACKEAYQFDHEFFGLTMTCWSPKSVEGKWIGCGDCKHCNIKREIIEEVIGR
jgi:7-cyano-7-deazaguanine synthase in queuosine biosynthesis